MTRVSLIAYDNWRTNHSGVATFVANIRELSSRDGVDFRIVEVPDRSSPAHSGIRRADASPGPSPHPRGPSALRLAMGYVRLLLDDAHTLARHRRTLRGRTIVTNRFGCETLPIALRILFPFSRIVVIGHTHPDVGSKGTNLVRRIVEKLNFRCASDLVFNSHAVREQWRTKLKLERMKGEVIWYGLAEPDLSVPEDYPSKPEGTVDFACVSRFVRWKGHRELLEAFNQAATRSSVPIRLVLVGDGATLTDSIQYARESGLPVFAAPLSSTSNGLVEKWSCLPRRSLPTKPGQEGSPVFFLGARPNASRYFNCADVGIQLSIEAEAFGQVFVEAGSRRKPVIGTRIGGIPEAVEDGKTGLLVEPGNIAGTADAILRLAGSASMRRKLGEAGYNRWRKHFTVSGMVDSYHAYFLKQHSRSQREENHE